MIGDGENPNVYFVTVGGNVSFISTDFFTAYGCWKVNSCMKNKETTLEDRKWGQICAVGKEDTSEKFVTIDDSNEFTKRYKIKFYA